MKGGLHLITFNQLRLEAESLYKSVGKLHCPALKSDVYFNSDGFHHLRYDQSRSERNKSEQKNKFLCLKSAISVIGCTTTIQEYRRVESLSRITEWFAFFAITSFSKQTRIKAIVRRVGGVGNFHFWSVMPFWNLTKDGRSVGSSDLEK